MLQTRLVGFAAGLDRRHQDAFLVFIDAETAGGFRVEVRGADAQLIGFRRRALGLLLRFLALG